MRRIHGPPGNRPNHVPPVPGGKSAVPTVRNALVEFCRRIGVVADAVAHLDISPDRILVTEYVLDDQGEVTYIDDTDEPASRVRFIDIDLTAAEDAPASPTDDGGGKDPGTDPGTGGDELGPGAGPIHRATDGGRT